MYYAHYDQFKLILYEHMPLAISLQETNFRNDYSPRLKDYKTFRKNRSGCIHATGGIVLFIKGSIDSEEINLNTTLEVVAAEMTLPNKIHLCSIYLPNSQAFDTDENKDFIGQLPELFIMMGDFNSHHTCWGSDKIDQRGKIIEKVIDDNPLITIINNMNIHTSIF